MITVREMIAQLPPESRQRIEELTQKLIAEEKTAREARKAQLQADRRPT